MRETESFNEGWKFKKTAQVPEAFPSDWADVTLPHTWNAVDGQDGGNDYWRGTVIYAKQFPIPSLEADGRLILDIPAAAMSAVVYCNGEKLFRHEGGYSAFRVDLTDHLKEQNLLCISVDNSANDTVYPQRADFTFYGGLYRGASLIKVSGTHFDMIEDGTPGIRVTPTVSPDGDGDVTVELFANGGDTVYVALADLGAVTANVENGKAVAQFHVPSAHLWNGTEDPYLYEVTAELFAGQETVPVDAVSCRFGFRTFTFDPQKGFLLNGKSYPLRGVSRHQDRKDVGNVLCEEDMEEDLRTIKEIGANTVRLAHYQHAQEFYDLCDENGIIVWAEIPFITRFMPEGEKNTISQLRELITQNYNHTCIACWALSNEITVSGGVTDALLENLEELNTLAHQLDPTRPTAMAHAFMLDKDSPIIPIADLGAWNLYFGWYLGTLDQTDEFLDEYHEMYPDRPVGFSEYGADANRAFHSARPESGDYSEEYQCVYHEHMLKMISARPWLFATYVWNLFDFAADGRDEGGKHGENQKGLVEFDHKTKKDAFYLYKAAWNQKDPFVHLCSKGYVHRAEEKTQVKVYSNQKSVTLYVDGKEFGTKEGKTIFTFEVPISGTHHIRAVSGDCHDESVIVKTEDFDPAYIFGGAEAGKVMNWFNKIEVKEGFFSIRDTLGEISKDPKAGAIVGKMMARASASRGDVATSSGSNANLQKMMAKMPLEQLLKKAGANVISPEQIAGINDMLQKIPKKIHDMRTDLENELKNSQN